MKKNEYMERNQQRKVDFKSTFRFVALLKIIQILLVSILVKTSVLYDSILMNRIKI